MPQALVQVLLIDWKFDFQTIDWRVVSVVVAVIGLVLVLYFNWWRNRKKLSYEVLSDLVLISAEKEIEDKVEIRFEGHSVKNVRVLVIKLINDGHQPIKKDDFEKSVDFIFPDAKILTAETVQFHPENLKTQMAYRDEKLEIDPALFNRKEYIKFKVLLSGFTTMKIDARIIGVSKIGEVKSFNFSIGDIVSLMFTLTLSIFTVFTVSEDIDLAKKIMMVGLLLISFGGGLILYKVLPIRR